jgi:transposase
MIGRQDRSQGTIFIMGSLGDLVPEDHILKRVDRAMDFSWLREEVRDCYCETNGRPGIDPEAALRLMLAGFFQGVVQDRKLMREAGVNVAIRWFAGYRLDEELPDHSSLTRIRQRWGQERFKRIFRRTVEACIRAGLVSGETVHVDATLIRADVSWESLTTEHAEKVLSENRDDPPEEPPPEGAEPKKKRGRPRTRPEHPRKWSPTDPDASMATHRKDQRLEPSYKQHTAVDDLAGVVVDVELTTGQADEGAGLSEVLERVEELTGRKVEAVTADARYASAANYRRMEERGTEAVIPPAPEASAPKHLPLRRFKYDPRRGVRCPGGKWLRRAGRAKNGWMYRARAGDCRECPLRARCLPPSARTRAVKIVNGYEALLRARRSRSRGWERPTRELYRRHRWRVEGAHGEGKTQHGLRRAVRRRRWNVAVQAYLTAAVMNLKRLAAVVLGGAGPEGLRGVFLRVLATLYGLLRAMSDACLNFHFAPLNATKNFIPTALAA